MPRSQPRFANRKLGSFHRATFESLEPRLALSADLAFAGAFQTLGGSTNSMFSGVHDLTRGGGLVTDGAGNSYVTVQGIGVHTVDLDPGPGVNAASMAAGLAKLDPSGAVVWNASFVAADVMRINHAVDADQNVYLVGDFRGTVDFDPGPGVANVTSFQGGSEYSVYFAKLNSEGQLQWVRKIDGRGLSPDRLVLDSQGNLVIAANFAPNAGTAPMDVDPGPDVALVQQISTGPGTDLLVLKYSANGDFLWVRQLAGTDGDMSSFKSIAVGNQDEIYVAGGFTGTVDLDPGAGTHLANSGDFIEGFVLRLNAPGDFVWAYSTVGGSSTAFLDLDVADDGSVVGSGYFRGVFDYDPGSGSPALAATGDNVEAFVIKLNDDASVAWARQFGNGRETITSEVDIDHEGNIYLGGSFGRLSPPGQIYDFDPGPGVYELGMPSSYETAFVLSLTDAGEFRWAVPLGGNAGASRVQGISVTADGNVQLSGAFKGTADFDPDPGAEYLLNSGTTQSVFVATLTQSGPIIGAPTVDAGEGQNILINGTASLDGTVTDDGLPGPLVTAWSLQSGPGAVTFGDASAVDTTATFSAVGTYLLKLEASDGMYTTADYVQVTVNPLSVALTATADTYIDGGSKTTNFGGSTNLIVDGQPDDGALLKWDLSSIPAGSTLQSAALSINVTNTSSNSYEIYEVKRTWTESQATWKKANSSTNWQSAGAQGTLDAGSTVLGTITATATGLKTITLNAAGLAVVQGWIDNPATNFGFIIRDYANSNKDDLVFSSKEATVAANRPQLNITYSPPVAVPLSAPQGGAASSSGGSGALAAMLEQSSSPAKKSATKSLTAATSSAAGSRRSASLLLATAPAHRIKSASVDSVMAASSAGESEWPMGSLDDELLLALVGV